MMRITLLAILVQALFLSKAYAQLENTYNPSTPYTNTTNRYDSAIRKPLKPLEDCRFYFQLGAGYNFASGIGTGYIVSENPNGTETTETKTSSLGKGLDIGVALGYKTKKNLGFELELGYVSGGKNKEQYSYYYSTNTTVDAGYFKANTVRINPKIVFEVPLSKHFSLYSKVGYMVGFGTAMYYNEGATYYNNGGFGSGKYERTLTGGLVSGTTFSMGFRQQMGRNVAFFGELTAVCSSRKFEKSTMTSATVNGKNVLNDKDTYYKETVFVDQLTTQTIYTYSAVNGTTLQTNTTTTTVDLNKPREQYSYKSNYSSFGFRLGIVAFF